MEEWKIEHESLDKTIYNQTQDLIEKDAEIEKLSGKLPKVTAMIPELMSYRSPSLVYAIFLKEQFLNFQMTYVMQGKSLTLNTPQEFFQDLHNIPIAIKIFLCELFLHNLVVLDDRDWKLLLYVGDIQLRELMSWI